MDIPNEYPAYRERYLFFPAVNFSVSKASAYAIFEQLFSSVGK